MAVTKANGIIAGAKSFQGNPYDGHTLPDVLNQIEDIVGHRPSVMICDRGYRGKKEIGVTSVKIPEPGSKSMTAHEKRIARERFRRRVAIEPIIGHLKGDHRMYRNYLKGVVGDAINLMLARAVFNFLKVYPDSLFFVPQISRVYISAFSPTCTGLGLRGRFKGFLGTTNYKP